MSFSERHAERALMLVPPEPEDARSVLVTARQARLLQEEGQRLVLEGNLDAGVALLALYLGWQSGRTV